MAKIDISALPKEEQAKVREALASGDYSSLSSPARRLLLQEEYNTGAVIARNLERGATETARGVQQLAGKDLGPDDLRKEMEARVMRELNPIAGYSSYVAGNLLDIFNFIPVPGLSKLGRAAPFVQGGIVGSAAGAAAPAYEEFGDSRLLNVGAGALFGSAAVGGLSLLTRRLAGKTADEVQDTLVNDAKKNLQAATTSPSSREINLQPIPKEQQIVDTGIDFTEEVPTPPVKVGEGAKPPATDIDAPVLNAPSPTIPEASQIIDNVKSVNEIPKLSSDLYDEPVSINNIKFGFESDIDKAAVAYQTNSPNKQQYLDYIKGALNVNDEQAGRVISDINREIKENIVQESIVQGQKPASAVARTTNTVDNIINPVTKHMDDESKYVYDFGNNLQERNGKLVVKNDQNFKNFHAKMNEIFPEISRDEAVITAQGYQRMMDLLKKEKGRKFTATNIRDFAANRESNVDAFIAAAKRGDFDGCW